MLPECEELRQRVATLEAENQRLETLTSAVLARNDQLEAELAESNDRFALAAALDRNVDAKAEATTVKAAGWWLQSAYDGDRSVTISGKGDRWVRTPREQLAYVAGRSVSVISTHGTTMERDGLIERHYEHECPERVDPETGVVMTDMTAQPKTVLYMRCKDGGTVKEMLARAATWTPSKRRERGSWGGKRFRCSTCGSENVETVRQCADCGAVTPIAPVQPPKEPAAPPEPAPTPVTPFPSPSGGRRILQHATPSASIVPTGAVSYLALQDATAAPLAVQCWRRDCVQPRSTSVASRFCEEHRAEWQRARGGDDDDGRR